MSNPSESLDATFAAMNKRMNAQLDALEKEFMNPTPQPKPKPNASPIVVNGKQAITGAAQSKPRPFHAWSKMSSSRTSSASKPDPGLAKTMNTTTASLNATLSRLEAEIMKPTPPAMPSYKPPTSFTTSSYTPSFSTTSFTPSFSSSFKPQKSTNTTTNSNLKSDSNSNSNSNSKQAKDAKFASLQRELAIAQAELSRRIKERGAKEFEGRKMELEATVMLVGATDKGKRFGNARVGYGHKSIDMVRAKEMLLEAQNVDVESAQLEVDRLLAAMRKCL